MPLPTLNPEMKFTVQQALAYWQYENMTHADVIELYHDYMICNEDSTTHILNFESWVIKETQDWHFITTNDFGIICH